MTTNASLVFDDETSYGFGRTHTANRLAAGIIVEENLPTLTDSFRQQFSEYLQTSDPVSHPAGSAGEMLQETFLMTSIRQVSHHISKALGTNKVEDHYRVLNRATILSETPVSVIFAIEYETGSRDNRSDIVGPIPPEGLASNDSFDVVPNGELRFSPFFVQFLNSNIYTVSKFIVRYGTGLGAATVDDLEPPLRIAIMEVAAQMDWNRGDNDKMADASVMSKNVRALLRPYKKIRVG